MNTQFAADVADAFIARAKIASKGLIELRVVQGVAERLKKHPAIMAGAIEDALAKNNLALSQKGMLSMATAYISDPFMAVKTLIDSSASKTDRIHAALGVLDYGIVNYGPLVGLQAVQGKSEAELCAALAEACPCPKEGVAAIDWGKVWAIVQPIALQLLQRLLFSS